MQRNTSDITDPILLNFASAVKQSTGGGGIEELLDTFFSFLQRKTDFYTAVESGRAETLLLSAFNKYRADAIRKQQEVAKEAEERLKRQRAVEEERQRRLDAETAARLARARESGKGAVTSTSTSGSTMEILDDEPEATPVPEKKPDAPKPGAAAASGDAEEDPIRKGQAEAATGGKAPSVGNGSSTDTYAWTQTLKDVEIRVPMGRPVKGRDVTVDVAAHKITIGLKGEAPLVEGALPHEVDTDETYWTIEDGRVVVLGLQKVNKMEWWKCAVVGEPEIDLQKVQPENSKLEDLDPDTRQTVEKMMFDQRQKAMGLPTSEERQKQDMLNKFMSAHPEMDFSQAKFC
eukprot:TRINITY_DN13765_c0_g1_i1.p1 TRINITY_DN13765_c0_g1~~TRINITY_DN13765_c0_g1_i1.p1  ORF type:complete len:347 (+),score=102.26 TRINITY_DN13765_c0_g1_i1:52-1092(+)